jgi:2-polyprenyl-6-methoxyphenol hydroxylase-like FAD-dependent oxidoreductase
MTACKGKVSIIGAGFSGIITAVALYKNGYEVTIFEKNPSFSIQDEPFYLWPSTLALLKKANLFDEIAIHSSLLSSLELYNDAGIFLQSIIFDKDYGNLISISARNLFKILKHHLPESKIHFKKKLIKYENQNNEIIAQFEDGSMAHSDILIGADGLNSTVRQQLANDGKPIFRGYAMWKGVLSFRNEIISENIMTEILGKGRRFGIIPIKDDKLGWWATSNETIKNYSHMSGRKKKISALFKNYNNLISEIINATPDDDINKSLVFDRNPIAKWHDGKAMLIGDAAHASTPDRMNGINLAFEDGIVLANLLIKNQNIESAYLAFEKERIPRTSLLTEKSLDHGTIGQWENKWAIRFRNFMLKRLSEEKKKHIKDVTFSYSPK